MQIKIITCQHVYNYGATLQAYALQTYIYSLGHDVEIIKFVPYYHHRYEVWNVNKQSHYYDKIKHNIFLHLLYAIKSNIRIYKWIGRKWAFDKFDKKYLYLTSKTYSTSMDLKKNPPVADVYIAGSDQLWNTDMPNGSEAAYYLDFGNKEVYRCSYAVSFGIESVASYMIDYVKKQLQRFDAISVREKTGLLVLKSLDINNAVQVVDPVFLLNKEDWLKVASKAKKYNLPPKYIMLYDFLGDFKITTFAKKCRKKLGLPIVSVNDHKKFSYADININDAGPAEFVSIIANAELVIANSFHAASFSIILNKELYIFPLSTQRNSSRMIDMMSDMGVVDRFNPSELSKQSINYQVVNINKEENQKKGINYLKSVLKC